MTIGRTGRPRHDDQLTPAEWRTVEGVRHGLSNPAIAARLGLSRDAVNFHVSNVLAKLGLTARTELQQWTGITRESPLHDNLDADGPLEITGVGQVARHVTEVASAVCWYADVLELRHLYTFGDMAFFDCGGVRLFVSKGDPSTNSVVYFATNDIVVAHARLVERRVRIVSAPHLIHRHPDGSEEWMCFFNDPDGGMLALMTTTRTASGGEQK